MRVAKWGNSLGVRLPKELVESMHLVEGDQVILAADSATELTIYRDSAREAALGRLRAFRAVLPDAFTFDRDEANERD